MSKFLSAIVLKNGDVLSHPLLDSHADLVTYFRLPDDTAYHQHFAKVELTPVDWMDAATWQFRLDENTAPCWWSDVETGVEQTLRDRAARMILRDGKHRLLVDGCWIIGGTAAVTDIRAGRVLRIGGSAIIRNVRDSAVIRNVEGSAVIRGVLGSAIISDIRGSVTISGVRGSAVIYNVGGSAVLSDIRGSATIRNVGESATIRDVKEWATIRNVGGSVTLDNSARAHRVV